MTGLLALPAPAQPTLPPARGPWTEALYALLRCGGSGGGSSGAALSDAGRPDAPVPDDPLADDDLQLALYLCYELHYRGLRDVEDRLEWSPLVLMLRASLEDCFETALRALAGDDAGDERPVGEELARLVRENTGPPLSRWVEANATHEQMLEHVVHRSAYQLKEADPHTWAIPRLTGRSKAALVEIQFDEYGGGRAERMHAVLFAQTMQALGLDHRYGAYLDHLPGITLATVNLVSWLGLHRRLRGAAVGHLAAFEMTSSVPNRRYGNALRRLGHGPAATAFYDEHVEADAVHEAIAAWDLADALAIDEPSLAPDIRFGARALLALEGRWASHLLEAWEQDESSLRRELAG